MKVRYLGIGSDCQYWSIMTRGGDQGWNSYTILSFETAKGYVEEDHDEIVSLTVDGIATLNARWVTVDNFGGYDVDDGRYRYYIVRWACESWQVKEDDIIELENVSYSLFENEWVCQGIWLDCVSFLQ